MANLTPTTGAHSMFLPKAGGAEDNSLESAIRMTIASGLRPTRMQDWLLLVSSIPNLDLINNNHGTKGAVPTDQGQLRGFPKPTVTLNYEVVTVGSYPNIQYQKLLVKPVLNNIVGYEIVVTLDVVEVDPTDGLDQHIETFTFAKGSLTPTSSTLTPDGSGKYRLDTTYPQPTNIEDLGMSVDYSADFETYLTESTTFNTSLTYTAATTVYSDGNFYEYPSNDCYETLGSQVTLFTITPPTTGGSVDPRWPVGTKFYLNGTLSLPAFNGYYNFTNTGGVFNDIYTIDSFNGNVGARKFCT